MTDRAALGRGIGQYFSRDAVTVTRSAFDDRDVPPLFAGVSSPRARRS